MIDDIIELSKKLIMIKSNPDNKFELESALTLVESYLSGFTIERFEKNGSKSILIYADFDRPQKFEVILNGHLDIIPGKDYQHIPKIVDDRLYGVGSMDMKSNVACLIMAFKEIANKVNYPIGLQIVTDEEIGGFNGTKHQVDQGVRTEFVIAGETTNFNIANKAKGVLHLRVTFQGKTAHGAYPRKGDNAILKANQFISLLENKYSILTEEERKTSINISKIETNNNSFNKVPDHCCVWLDIRYLSEDSKSILTEIKDIYRDCVIEVVANEPALYTDENDYYIQRLKKVTEKLLGSDILLYGANGTSDARHYSYSGASAIEFGPIGGGIGTDEEWISINSLEIYCNVLNEFLLSL